jgi:hypothetical protein
MNGGEVAAQLWTNAAIVQSGLYQSRGVTLAFTAELIAYTGWNSSRAGVVDAIGVQITSR